MLTARKILYATDFSPCSRQALQQAFYWAKACGAELHLFHAMLLDVLMPDAYGAILYGPVESSAAAERLRNWAEDEMKKLTDPIQGGGVELQVHIVQTSSPAASILEAARSLEADLMVLGTHGRRGVGRWILGSVAEQVMREAKCPVLAVREQATDVPPRVGRILVPVDLSDVCPAAITRAREVAARFDAEVDVLHVVPEPMMAAAYPPSAAVLPAFDPADAMTRAEEHLKDLLEQTEGAPVPINVRVTCDQPVGCIVEHAKEKGIDLIVMATHGRRGVERLLLGSTTERVLRLAPCPVLVVGKCG